MIPGLLYDCLTLRFRQPPLLLPLGRHRRLLAQGKVGAGRGCAFF